MACLGLQCQTVLRFVVDWCDGCVISSDMAASKVPPQVAKRYMLSCENTEASGPFFFDEG